jgi:hypothetical protein
MAHQVVQSRMKTAHEDAEAIGMGVGSDPYSGYAIPVRRRETAYAMIEQKRSLVPLIEPEGHHRTASPREPRAMRPDA